MYNFAGLLTAKDELARSGNTIDSNAGLAGGLHSTYIYDSAGNLTQKTERGLITDYQYNSLGKVIAESRPHTAAGNTYWKLNTYRLDGLNTAKTTYDYTGSLSNNPDVLIAKDANFSVTTGNVTVMEYNLRGDQLSELSYAPGRTNESTWLQWTNGLGQRYQRAFTGSKDIYAEQRTSTGAPLNHANYMTSGETTRTVT